MITEGICGIYFPFKGVAGYKKFENCWFRLKKKGDKNNA